MRDLKSIKIIFCAPDTLRLYGIPYDMRPGIGQEPRHLWKGRTIPDTLKRAAGWGGSVLSDPGPGPDWIYLDEEDPEVKAFLAEHKDNLPGHAYEWVRL